MFIELLAAAEDILSMSSSFKYSNFPQTPIDSRAYMTISDDDQSSGTYYFSAVTAP